MPLTVIDLHVRDIEGIIQIFQGVYGIPESQARGNSRSGNGYRLLDRVVGIVVPSQSGHPLPAMGAFGGAKGVAGAFHINSYRPICVRIGQPIFKARIL